MFADGATLRYRSRHLEENDRLSADLDRLASYHVSAPGEGSCGSLCGNIYGCFDRMQSSSAFSSHRSVFRNSWSQSQVVSCLWECPLLLWPAQSGFGGAWAGYWTPLNLYGSFDTANAPGR